MKFIHMVKRMESITLLIFDLITQHFPFVFCFTVQSIYAEHFSLNSHIDIWRRVPAITSRHLIYSDKDQQVLYLLLSLLLSLVSLSPCFVFCCWHCYYSHYYHCNSYCCYYNPLIMNIVAYIHIITK